MGSTRTHTSYWSPDDVAPLKAAIKELYNDFQDRSPYIDTDARVAMQHRLSILTMAAELLTDWAD